MLGLFADTFVTYQMARDFYARSAETESMCEPLAEIFAYMQRNIQTHLSSSEWTKWRKHVEELIDNRLRQTFYERDALPAQVRSFWLGLYGRNVFERTLNATYAGIFIRLRRLETFVKNHVIQPFRKKTFFRRTMP